MRREEAPVARPAPANPKELGWLPDCVYTGEAFETGLAFFADAVGRITRFSREPADLAAARRLAGQAALPGLINGHSVAWQRLLRGRTEQRLRAGTDDLAAWAEAQARLAGQLQPEDAYDAARMAFTEMLLAGITGVGEFHELLWQRDGSAWPQPQAVADAILRAAHDTGIRIALFPVARIRGAHAQPVGSAPAQTGCGSIEAFLREAESLQSAITARYPADEAWLGVAAASLGTVPLDALKAIANHAHAQRLRLQVAAAVRRADVEACVAEYGRTPVALLAEHGIVDKRLTVIHGGHLSDEECRVLGAARAAVCACPIAEQNLGLATAPAEPLLAAGAGVALGTANQTQIDLLKEARLLEYRARAAAGHRPALAPEPAKLLFRAATVAAARSLGGTGGALEVGRPADFFTVNLFDPSIAGAGPDALLANIVFALERRAIREVWVGARQRVANARHADQGAIVGRFVTLQERLWRGA